MQAEAASLSFIDKHWVPCSRKREHGTRSILFLGPLRVVLSAQQQRSACWYDAETIFRRGDFAASIHPPDPICAPRGSPAAECSRAISSARSAAILPLLQQAEDQQAADQGYIERRA